VTGDLRYNFAGGSVGPSVYCTAIAADESKVAIGGTDGPTLIWDTKAEGQDRGRHKCLILRHPAVKVHCLAFSPNDKILAAGYEYDPPPRGVGLGRGGVLIFDVSSGKLLVNQDARIGAVYGLTFSPDGRLLVTADGDQAVKLWEVPLAWQKKDK
jgi:WD40 repeat protein